MNLKSILYILNKYKDPAMAGSMARFGITSSAIYGVSLPELRRIAKEAGTDHELAADLWEEGSREARILAGMIDDPALVTVEQMEAWAADFDSWEICDQCCSNLFRKTSHAWPMALEWTGREDQYVKRAGFVLAAVRAVGDRESDNKKFERFFEIIVRESADGRNYVMKSVNWALRQIGKKNLHLNRKAVETAEKIAAVDSKCARWIASGALRELTGKAVTDRLRGD